MWRQAGPARPPATHGPAGCAVPIEYVGSDAEALPVPDASVDHVLSTWTLCAVPDVMRTLAEIRRVLRPGGAFGGCHLNRPIDQLVAAAGLELTQIDTYYMKGPRALGYTFEGVAIRP